MQYHYVVGYNSDKKQWWVEFDPTAYFPDGNVWSDEQWRDTGYGWLYPEEDSPEAAMDMELFHTLQACIPGILPVPQGA